MYFNMVRGAAYLVRPSNFLNERNYFVAGRRIETTGRLVKKHNLWFSDKLAGNTNSTLLATTDSLTNGCTNNGVRLVL